MTRLPFRLFVILLALAATGALGYRAFQTDLGVGATLDGARRSEQAVSSARLALASLDATMRSLVAPGQRARTWSEEAERQLDQVRERLIALEGFSPVSGEHPLDGALDSVDRLAASAVRVRDHMDSGQALLAGDLVFNEARGTIAGLDQQVERTGSLERGRHAAGLSSLRQEQGLLVGGVVAAWLFAAILLLPTGRASKASETTTDASHATFGNLGGRSEAPWGRPEAPEASGRSSGGTTPEAPVTPGAPETSGRVPAEALSSTAALCTDLARVTDSREIAALLERASEVLDASGVIVWVAGPTGMELFPVASHGYDERIFARIGSIRRDAANLTAAAFRGTTMRTSQALGGSAAALAAPLVGPAGIAGVLSAEFRGTADVTPGAAALATILAAQIATLVGSMPGSAADAAPPAQQANA
jgi:hypothetical protein